MPYRDVFRVQVVLLAAQGLRNEQIADRLNAGRDVVSKWRKRFFEQRLAGLDELPRGGRPDLFSPDVVVEVKAIAGQLPAELGLPVARLQVGDIRDEVLRRGLVAEISGSTIGCWLDEDALRPWTFRSWIFPRDPDFEAKAGRVLDLYAGKFEGRRLGPNEFVISADEKTSIQARRRCHPSLPPASGRALRVEHEYEVMVVLPPEGCAPRLTRSRIYQPAPEPKLPWRAWGLEHRHCLSSMSARFSFLRTSNRPTRRWIPAKLESRQESGRMGFVLAIQV